ncbi:hypothetical protein POM88_029084 [Heracleum sosnowskyi]|uniref:Uncharacterized protein n=1 Tax=Heracleum sosnowskyi TaxID=360622 RepID=A0AAD8HTF1_9APIA|nr:hypothetical protein POM88_029084 [Heracleum sosnowskyi]
MKGMFMCGVGRGHLSMGPKFLGVKNCKVVNSGRGKRRSYDGHSFRALFRRQFNVKATAVISDRNGLNSTERDGIVEKTSANAEKLVGDSSKEEQVQTSEVAGSDLVKKIP